MTPSHSMALWSHLPASPKHDVALFPLRFCSLVFLSSSSDKTCHPLSSVYCTRLAVQGAMGASEVSAVQGAMCASEVSAVQGAMGASEVSLVQGAMGASEVSAVQGAMCASEVSAVQGAMGASEVSAV